MSANFSSYFDGNMLNKDILRPNSDVIMESIKNSPVLQKMNTETLVGVDQGLTTTEWTKVWQCNIMKEDEKRIAKAATTA
jgi:hypothetical protein